jgi:hypothetical protein
MTHEISQIILVTQMYSFPKWKLLMPHIAHEEEQVALQKVPTSKHTYPVAAQPSEEILTGKFF